MKKYLLKTQFIISFICIIVFSLLMTILTYLFVFHIFSNNKNKAIYPSNYFEERIPKFRSYIEKEGINLLNIQEEKALKNVISNNNASFEVLDENANIIYGTNKERIIKNRLDLYHNINVNLVIDGNLQNHRETFPIINSSGKILGGVLITYKLTPTYTNNMIKALFILLVVVTLISPFFYVVLFTLIFSKLLENNINTPLKMLIKASKNIKEKNLDFNINYESNNEIGQLCQAFNDMKIELQKSLVSQWRMEQEKLDMVESLVHDMKTPLSIISGYIELIESSNLTDNEKFQKYISTIKTNIDRSFSFIRKIQYNDLNTNIKLTCIDIITFIKKKVENYNIISKQNNITITLNIDNEQKFEKSIFINIENLERIIDNIMSNSFRYTPQNGHINITLKIDTKKVYLSIWNSGIPFYISDIDNIFNKAYRGSILNKKENPDLHAGLGLYIAKQLTEQNGGTIHAFNPKEGGACIEFNIKCGL